MHAAESPWQVPGEFLRCHGSFPPSGMGEHAAPRARQRRSPGHPAGGDGGTSPSPEACEKTHCYMGPPEGTCDRTQHATTTFSNLLVCNELGLRRVSDTARHRLVEEHSRRSMFSRGCDLHCVSSHCPSRYPNYQAGRVKSACQETAPRHSCRRGDTRVSRGRCRVR
jgi:hypothetical protein